jgi:hypothetical protein
VYGGAVVRFREHVKEVFSKHKPTAPRYSIWRHFGPESLFFMPIFGGTLQETTKWEMEAIRYARPPSQRFEYTVRDTLVSKPRPWPRHRQGTSPARECALNMAVQHRLCKNPFRKLGVWASWKQALDWVFHAWGILPTVLRENIYNPGYEFVLLLCVAEPSHSLDWRRVWKMQRPRHTLSWLWLQANSLDANRKVRVRGKVKRFIDTAMWIPFRCSTIVVPTNSKQHLYQFRKAIAKAIDIKMEKEDFLLRKMAKTWLRLAPSRPQKMHELLQAHHRLAATIQGDEWQKLTPEEKRGAMDMQDVVWLDANLAVERKTCLSEIKKVWQGATQQLGLDADDGTMLWEDLRKNLERTGNLENDELASALADQANGKAIVQVDRDPKRGIYVDPEWYKARVVHTLLSDPDTYEILHGSSIDDVLGMRKAMVEKYLPTRIWKRKNFRWNHGCLPCYTLTPKGKCFDKQTKQFKCTKEHQHARELVSYGQDVVKPYLSRMATALVTVFRRSRFWRISLQHPHKLTGILREKSKLLRSADTCQHCGCALHGLSVVKSDASAYFRFVDRERCIRNAKALLADGERRGFNGVMFNLRNPKMCKLHINGDRVPKGWKTMEFGEIANCIEFFGADSWMRAGHLAVFRRRGLPMGSPLSPPTTTIDLEMSLGAVFDNKSLAKKIGWATPRFATGKCIALVLYVDDLLCWSACICPTCIWNGITTLAPKDVGMSQEHVSTGVAQLDFLHARLAVRQQQNKNGTWFDVRPLLHNRDFSQRLDRHPKVAKVALFLGPREHDVGELRAYLLARLLCFEAIFEGCDDQHELGDVAEDTAILLVEPMRLKWPPGWVAKCLLSYPFYKTSLFARGVRTIGRLLKRNAVLGIWFSDTSMFWHSFDALPELRAVCTLGFELAAAVDRQQTSVRIPRKLM